MAVMQIDPVSDERWDPMVMDHPMGCVYHHSAWKEVLNRTFRHIQSVYFAREQDNKITGGVPFFLIKSPLTGKRLVSLPFSFYCDPLVDSELEFKELMDEVARKQKDLGASFIQMRTRFMRPMLQNTGFKEFPGFKNHVLSLDQDTESMMRSFHRTCVRQRIHRAEESGITVKEGTTADDVQTFYDLHCTTRKKHGVPPQPFRFFQNMWDILAPKRMMYLSTAFYKDVPVSSLLCLRFKDRVHGEYMGIDDRFKQFSGNILLFWNMIQKSKSDGYKFFEFGCSPSNDSHVIEFKRRWGTVEEDISYFYLPDIRGFSSGIGRSLPYRLLEGAGKSMPMALFKWSGEQIYNHIGG